MKMSAAAPPPKENLKSKFSILVIKCIGLGKKYFQSVKWTKSVSHLSNFKKPHRNRADGFYYQSWSIEKFKKSGRGEKMALQNDGRDLNLSIGAHIYFIVETWAEHPSVFASKTRFGGAKDFAPTLYFERPQH